MVFPLCCPQAWFLHRWGNTMKLVKDISSHLPKTLLWIKYKWDFHQAPMVILAYQEYLPWGRVVRILLECGQWLSSRYLQKQSNHTLHHELKPSVGLQTQVAFPVSTSLLYDLSDVLRFAVILNSAFLFYLLWSDPDVLANASFWLWQQRKDILTKTSLVLQELLCIYWTKSISLKKNKLSPAESRIIDSFTGRSW